MIMNLFDLSGKTAIVTGSNTGLGQAICVGLSEAGCNIVGVSRRSSEETKKLVEKNNRKFYEINADLSNIDSVTEIINESIKFYGKVGILGNNAGMILRNDSIDVTEEDWDKVLNVNLKSVFFLSTEFAKNCIANNHCGKIINIASMLSYQGGFRVASYCASKSAIMGITKSLCNEWAIKGINVNAIAPGYFETNNTKDIKNDQNRNEAILERIPAGRWGKPNDLIGAVIFLSSEASNYVNGFTLAVDGGWLAR